MEWKRKNPSEALQGKNRREPQLPVSREKIERGLNLELEEESGSRNRKN
jgi:hypothetical protein